MPTEDQSFEASGPTTVAFETITDQQAVGVGASGTTCGVFGSSSSSQGSRPPNDVGPGIGVVGIGDVIGVSGGGSIAVKGDGDRTGVLGIGREVGVLAQHHGKFSTEAAAISAQSVETSSNQSAIAIHGWSPSNRAGVFATGPRKPLPPLVMGSVIAQIHLVPISEPTTPT
jgi:hypothetical protein